MAIHLPPIKLDYLKALTDDTGIFQFAKFCVPSRSEGYTTDDNSRALVVCTMYHGLKKDPQIEALASVYLAFLNHMQKPEGNFHNYLSYERTFQDIDGSGDCVGRTLWACGCAINSTLPKYMKMAAKDIFDRDLPWIKKSTYLRLDASAILGLSQYYQASKDDSLKAIVEKLADNLVKEYQNEAKDDWRWFESTLTYDNARLPQALFEAYSTVGKEKYVEAAKETMAFLIKTQMINNVFVPIGSEGWYRRGENRAIYDQQPIEAGAMVEAAAAAFYATQDKSYLQIAETAFEWFLGRNSRRQQMYNPETGGCFDGLAPEKVNMNQGAESSVSYLLARLKLEELKRGNLKRRRD